MESAADLEPTFERIAQQRISAVAIGLSPLTSVNQARIAALVQRHHLAAIADGAGYSEAGLLLTYTTDFDELDRRCADYVFKILNGAKPSDLPVEQASKFILVLNLKTAKDLGLKFPNSLLTSADKIIE